MEKATVSTGEAAAQCSVEPDTILKWIRGNKVSATRTAGGHFRIDRESLQPFLARTGADGIEGTGLFQPGRPETMRCWEFFSKERKNPGQCSECIVWKANIEKCFVVAKSGLKPLHLGLYCKDQCRSCSYFKLINKSRYRLLLLSSDAKMIDAFRNQKHIQFEAQSASCGYEASAVIQKFQPDMIVVDREFCCGKSKGLMRNLKKDPRNNRTLFAWAASGQNQKEAGKESKIPFIQVHSIFNDALTLINQASSPSVSG